MYDVKVVVVVVAPSIVVVGCVVCVGRVVLVVLSVVAVFCVVVGSVVAPANVVVVAVFFSESSMYPDRLRRANTVNRIITRLSIFRLFPCGRLYWYHTIPSSVG